MMMKSDSNRIEEEDEEKALPTGNMNNNEPLENNRGGTTSRKKVTLLLSLSFLVLAGIIVAITVPLVRNKNDNDSSSSSKELEDSKDDDPTSSDDPNLPGPTSDPTTVSPTEDEDNDAPPSITPYSAFNVTLPPFDESLLQGYDGSEDAFAHDFNNGLRQLLDRVIARNLGLPGYENVGRGEAGGNMFFDDVVDMPEDGDMAPAMPSPNRDDGVGDNVNDYGTNNQEKGIEEGDIVVANQDFLFAAYGDYILVWDTTSGKRVVDYKLPPLYDEEEVFPTKPPITLEEPEPLPPDGPPNRQRRNSMWYRPQNPSIQSMMLRGTKLIVVATGYGYQYEYSMEHVIDSYKGTRVMILDASSMFETNNGGIFILNLEATKDLSGRFVSARSMGDDVHLVTEAGISYYERLIRPFEKSPYGNEEYFTQSDENYVKTVTVTANEKVIPDFTRTFMEDVRVDGDLPAFFRLSNWMDDKNGDSVAPQAYPEGYLQGVALAYSFNIPNAVSSVNESEEFTGVKASGAILPSAYGTKVYSSFDTMILATEGMGYSDEHEAVIQKTYIMSLKLSGASTLPHTVGTVKGYILNQFSMDEFNGVLRMATTIRRMWFWGIRPMLPMPEVDVVDVVEEDVTTWEDSTTENYVMTLSVDGEDLDNNSTTPSVMQVLDEIKIGKPNEVITAVRFFDKYAYAVTFEQTDPFYKLNMTDATSIGILAEINITGFSQYLHAIDDDEEMILAIGQEADENGMVLGLSISLFDVRNVKKPNVVRTTVEIARDTYSSSDALWDKNAIRYNKETRLLIIPVNIYTYNGQNNFNGFQVFSVSDTEIVQEEACSIDYTNVANVGTEPDMMIERYCASLSPRAMIFEGSMVLLKDHYITRVDLDTCLVDQSAEDALEWQYDIVIRDADGNSCFYYY